MKKSAAVLGTLGLVLLAIAIVLRLFVGLEPSAQRPADASVFLFALAFSLVILAVVFIVALRRLPQAKRRLRATRPDALIYTVVADEYFYQALRELGRPVQRKPRYMALAADSNGLLVSDGRSAHWFFAWAEVHSVSAALGRSRYSIATWAKVQVTIRLGGHEAVLPISVLPGEDASNPTVSEARRISEEIEALRLRE